MENICQSTRKVSNVLDQLLLESTDFPSLFCGTYGGLNLSCLDSNPLESTRLFFKIFIDEPNRVKWPYLVIVHF